MFYVSSYNRNSTLHSVSMDVFHGIVLEGSEVHGLVLKEGSLFPWLSGWDILPDVIQHPTVTKISLMKF